MTLKTAPKTRPRPQATSKTMPATRQRRQPPSLEMQLDRVTAVLKEALERQDLAPFYAALRRTDLPFFTARHLDDSRGIARTCFDILQRLAGLSPAVGLAIKNHLYVTAALATFPKAVPGLTERSRSLLSRVAAKRLLVVNTSSKVHADRLGTLGTRAVPDGKGYRVHGTASFMSLATQGDLLFFLTLVEDAGLAVFVIPLKGRQDVEIGPLLFPRAMVDSDTRKVVFHDVFLPADCLLAIGAGNLMSALMTFQMSWHQTLLAALSLGAAAGAIEEARRFLRTVSGPGGQPLAELDGMMTDVGRLVIRYRAACSFVHRAGEQLEAMAGRALDPVALEQAFDFACAAKYTATECAEEVVTRARRIVGSRTFVGSQPLERLSQEVMFGPLAGEVHALIERRHGRRALGEQEFPPRRW